MKDKNKQGLNAVVAGVFTVATMIAAFSMTSFGQSGSDISFKGDLRVRHQLEDQGAGKDQRSRGRVRFRLGTEGVVNDTTKVYAGLASGGDDPRSTNQTFEKGSSTKGIQLDYAYTKLIVSGHDVFAGKMKNPLWRVSDLMWDSDIRPEGLALKTDVMGAKLNAAYFVLAEDKESKFDPYMFALQGIKKWSLNDTASLDTGLTFYMANNLKGALHEASETNTLVDNKYDNDFSILALSTKLNISDILGVERVSVIADYLQNSGVSKENTGFLVGVTFGSKKVKQLGDWQATLQYRQLEKDATLDSLPDSDFYGGATGVKGWELITSYGLSKNTKLTVDYYLAELIDKPTGSDDTDQRALVQVDLSVKF